MISFLLSVQGGKCRLSRSAPQQSAPNSCSLVAEKKVTPKVSPKRSPRGESGQTRSPDTPNGDDSCACRDDAGKDKDDEADGGADGKVDGNGADDGAAEEDKASEGEGSGNSSHNSKMVKHPYTGLKSETGLV